MTYEELKARFEVIESSENPEDRALEIIRLQNDLASIEDEKDVLKDRIRELEDTISAKDGRIENLRKRNDELRYMLGDRDYVLEVKKDDVEEKEVTEVDEFDSDEETFEEIIKKLK